MSQYGTYYLGHKKIPTYVVGCMRHVNTVPGPFGQVYPIQSRTYRMLTEGEHAESMMHVHLSLETDSWWLSSDEIWYVMSLCLWQPFVHIWEVYITTCPNVCAIEWHNASPFGLIDVWLAYSWHKTHDDWTCPHFNWIEHIMVWHTAWCGLSVLRAFLT